MGKLFAVVICILIVSQVVAAQVAGSRVLSGVVVTAKEELVPRVTISVTWSGGKVSTVSDSEGSFLLAVPEVALTLELSGSNIRLVAQQIGTTEETENLSSAANLRIRSSRISHYRLDPLDAGIRAAGHDVVDFSLSKRIRRFVHLNFAIDNLFQQGLL